MGKNLKINIYINQVIEKYAEVKIYQYALKLKWILLASINLLSNQYYSLIKNPKHNKDNTSCNLYTWAFFQQYKKDQNESEVIT